MRTFRPSTSRPLARLALGALLCALALPAAAQDQPSTPKKKAAGPPPTPPDTRPLARYLPLERVGVYVEFAGLEARGDEWRKTPAYRLLNQTQVGVMLEEVAKQLAQKVIEPYPNLRITGEEVVLLCEHIANSGFAFALVDGGPGAKPSALLVLRGAARKEVRAPFSRLLGSFTSATGKPQLVKKGKGRAVVIMPGMLPDSDWAWWSEGDDVIIAPDRANSADVAIAVLDGVKPNAVAHPDRIALLKDEAGFAPVGIGFIDPAHLGDLSAPTAAAPPAVKFVLSELNKGGVKRVNYRWGFQENAVCSELRILAPRPRRGALALFDQPTFEKGKLPPLPKELTGFTAFSMDGVKVYDALLELAKSLGPQVESRVNESIKSLQSKTHIDFRKDLLAKIGPRMAVYLAAEKPPESEEPEPPGPGILEGLAGGLNPTSLASMAALGQIPKLTFVAEVADEEAFGRALDELMILINHELEAQQVAMLKEEEEATTKAQGGGRAGTARRERHDQGPPPSPRFTRMPGKSRVFVLNVPVEIARLPAGVRPTIRMGPHRVAFSVSPEAARQALDVKEGMGWAPAGELIADFQRIPAGLVLLNVFDARGVMPALLASFPAKVQAGINGAIIQARIKASGAAKATPASPTAVASKSKAAAKPARRPRPRPPVVAYNEEDEGEVGLGGLGGGGGGGPGPRARVRSAPVGPKISTENLVHVAVDPAKMPKAEELKDGLFPGTLTIAVDDQGVSISRRGALPNLVLPFGAAGMVVALPEIRKAQAVTPPAGKPSASAVAAPTNAKPNAPATTAPPASRRRRDRE